MNTAPPKDDMGQNIMTQLQSTLSSSSDLKDQSDINDALIKAGLPMNKINEMIESSKDTLLCNSNCQRDKKAKELRNSLCNAEKTLVTAPGNVSDAERNYYVYTKGEKGYEDIMYKRYVGEANTIKLDATVKHRSLMTEMDELVDIYKVNTTNLSRLNELLSIRLKENEELKKTIDDDTGSKSTNQRRVVYGDRELEWLNTVRKVLIYCCLLLFIVYLVFSDFFRNARYKNIKEWVLIVALFVYVFNVNTLAQWTFLLIHKIIYFYNYAAPKNVYTNL